VVVVNALHWCQLAWSPPYEELCGHVGLLCCFLACMFNKNVVRNGELEWKSIAGVKKW